MIMIVSITSTCSFTALCAVRYSITGKVFVFLAKVFVFICKKNRNYSVCLKMSF